MTQTVEPREGLGTLGREVAQDAVRLVRAEIELARAQVIDAVKRLIIAAVLGALAGMFLLIALVEALGALPSEFGPTFFHSRYWGWLVLGGFFALLAALFAVVAFSRVRKSVAEGKQTVDTLKEDSEWLKQLSKRSGSAS